MSKSLNCPFCSIELDFVGVNHIGIDEKKKKSFFTVTYKNIAAKVYQCSKCGRLEFYNPLIADKPELQKRQPSGESKNMDCLRCGRNFEKVFGHCPYCGWESEE